MTEEDNEKSRNELCLLQKDFLDQCFEDMKCLEDLQYIPVIMPWEAWYTEYEETIMVNFLP
jgi:hypothetical protein